MKRLLSFFLLFILCSSIYAAKPVEINYRNYSVDNLILQPPFDQHLTIDMLKGLDSICAKPEGDFTILIDDNQIIANRNGFLNVYLWENDKWIDLYKGNYGGHNFGRFCFLYNGDLYTYGGYGYWYFNSNLIKFNKTAGGWDLIQSFDQFNGLIIPFVRIVGNTLQTCGGYFQYQGQTIPNEHKGEINLDNNSLKIKPSSFKLDTMLFNPNQGLSKVYNLKNYGFIRIDKYNQMSFLIHNFETGQYYLQNEIISQLEIFPLTYSDGEQFIYLDLKNKINSITEEDLMKGAKPIGKPSQNKLTDSKKLLTTGATLGVLLLLSGYLFYRKRKRFQTPSATSSIKFESEDEQIIKMMGDLSVIENTVITPSKLDQILQINELDLDSKRARRSQLIKTINAFTLDKIGFEYIHRIRDDKDKRYVNYKIGKSSDKVK